uniref:IPPc domain-containing protein n=1 Tax=Panagrellus redivivus TaxID=6233 RepID=A0A7E4ULU9_PANRE
MGIVFLYTFNVGKSFPAGAFESFQVYQDAKEDKARIWAVALQEVPNGEVSGITIKSRTWLNFFINMMSSANKTLIHHRYLLSNLLMVFSDLDFAKFLQKIENRSVKYTLGGTLGYKSTMGIRILLRNGVDLVFVTSHLVHGEANADLRCKQYELAKMCLFDDTLDVSEHRIVFWLGDLNFRVEGGHTSDLFTAYEGVGRHATCSHADQLHQVLKKKLIFEDFTEPEIKFSPSYRFKVGTCLYDHARAPSWCDRILVKQYNLPYTNLVYDLDIPVQVSDHLPVYATYEIPQLLKADYIVDNICNFQPIPCWTCSVYFMCQFGFNNGYYAEQGSNRDWVGFYSLPIKNIKEPDGWMYMGLCYESNDFASQPVEASSLKTLTGNSVDNKRYVAEWSSLKVGRYVVGYYSVKYDTLIGISNVFTVRASV